MNRYRVIAKESQPIPIRTNKENIMYPKPLHQIVDEYKERERKGEKTNRYYSPTIKSHIKPFKDTEKKIKNDNGEKR